MRANMRFAERNAAHEKDAEHRCQQAERRREDEIVGPTNGHSRARRCRFRPVRAGLRHQEADQRRDADWRQAGRRIAADDQFEAVKRAGERRSKGPGIRGSAVPTRDARLPRRKCNAPPIREAMPLASCAYCFEADPRADAA